MLISLPLAISLQNLLPTLLALPESLLAKPALESPAPSADPKPAIQDAFTTQAETLEHMRSEMDALANHLEQVSSAVRDEEEGEEVDGESGQVCLIRRVMFMLTRSLFWQC